MKPKKPIAFKNAPLRPTCLIVDDHRGLRNLLKTWLTSLFPAVEFFTAISAEDALEITAEIKPDLIIMDIGLPNQNGLEATRHIKQIFPQTIVIIHTIHEESIYKEKAASIGADFFISKKRTQTALPVALKTAFSSIESRY